MKVVFVSLSGDPQLARDKLAEHYPSAMIETTSRMAIKTGSLVRRFRALRAQRADVFAIATEHLAWQRGQNLFMLFGALAGASQVVMLDDYGALRTESRASLLLKAPVRIARDAILSATTLARAKSEVRQLETEIENRLADSAQVRQLAQTPATRALADALPLRIVYIRATPGPGAKAGGASSHIKGVIDGLLELGAEVRLISNGGIAGVDEQDPSKTPMTIIGPEPVGATRAIFDIHNNSVFSSGAVPLIEKDPPDFIYERYARFAWAGVVASLRSRRPLFLEYNGSEVWVGRHWDHVGMLKLLARYERLNLEGAARIFVVSDVERRNLERAGIDPDKIIVNPNGVDTKKFRPGVGGDRVRREIGVRDEELLVGFVGTFGPWHGVLALAEAIKLVPPNSGVLFLLVGIGALHSEMRSLLKAEENEGRVMFTGAVGHEQVPALLDACDVLVSPHVPMVDGSEFFGSPTKIFEYMAMGKSIVASNLGQIGEVLTDNETALLVEPGNAKQMSASIMRLAESPELRERLGESARRLAVERHTWTRNAQNVLDAYSSWLEETKAR
jgi:glycosyltransferase involved in cell wall biosynthesis